MNYPLLINQVLINLQLIKLNKELLNKDKEFIGLFNQAFRNKYLVDLNKSFK
jgi:hypothetical protein